MAKQTLGTTKMTDACAKLSALAAELCAIVPQAPSDERATLIEFAGELFKLADENLPVVAAAAKEEEEEEEEAKEEKPTAPKRKK